MAEKDEREGGSPEAKGAASKATLELQLDELDVRSIMESIEERVEERRKDGLYRDLPLQELEDERTGGAEPQVIIDPLHELIFLLQVARQYANVDSHYPIGARRSPLGPFILVTKKFIRRFMTPYMNAVFSKQRQFNTQCIRSIEAFLDLIEKERERSYQGGLDRYTAWVEMGLKGDTDSLLVEAVRRFPPEVRILEPGCGAGEFLLAARGEGREALGVEEDPRLVSICQERDARVVQANAMDYLEAIPSKSLGAVFFSDMGERGDMKELLWMVTALADKMEAEGTVVALNHNPRSAWGVEEAFQDPSLLRLVHPETLENLFRQAGFQEVEVALVGEYSAEEKEKVGAAAGGWPELEYGTIDELLFTPRRYMLKARR